HCPNDRDSALLRMRAELPPARGFRVQGKQLGPWTQPHAGDPQAGKPDIVPKTTVPDSLLRQLRESGIEIGINVKLLVVTSDEVLGGFVLLARVESALREQTEVYGLAVDLPVHLGYGDKVHNPGLHPAIEA